MEAGVSVRTVYRDLNLLQEAGIPLCLDEDRRGYVIDSIFRLRASPLANEELCALMIAACTLPTSVGNRYEAALRQAHSKLLSQLPCEFREQVGHVLARYRPYAANPDQAEAIYPVVLNAMQDHRQSG
jgi:predicted DNA-binding transcriptional regulator YafY